MMPPAQSHIQATPGRGTVAGQAPGGQPPLPDHTMNTQSPQSNNTQQTIR